MRLTPQISEGDVVRLDLYEEVSALVPNPLVDANLAGPTTTVRSASTTVVARDGQTVVIGGLISDDAVSTQSKLPFIGDIPVLGNLFKQNNDRREKINLLIFLTPHVVHDDADLQEISIDQREQFKRYLHQEKLGPRHYEQLNTPSWNAASATPPAGGAAPNARSWRRRRVPCSSSYACDPDRALTRADTPGAGGDRAATGGAASAATADRA